MNNRFAFVENGQIKQFVKRGGAINGKRLGKLSPDSTYIAMGLLPITGTAPVYNSETHNCTGPSYEIDAENKQVVKKYSVKEKAQAEKDAILAAEAKQAAIEAARSTLKSKALTLEERVAALEILVAG